MYTPDTRLFSPSEQGIVFLTIWWKEGQKIDYKSEHSVRAGHYHSEWPTYKKCMNDIYNAPLFPLPEVSVRLGTSGPVILKGVCRASPALSPYYADFMLDNIDAEEENGSFKLLFCYPTAYIGYFCIDAIIDHEAFERLDNYTCVTIQYKGSRQDDELCCERTESPCGF